MGFSMRYRSSLIDQITFNGDGSIKNITMTRTGVKRAGNLDPYVLNEAETIGVMGGVFTRADSEAGNGMVVTAIDSGDWVCVYNVDFGSGGAKKFTARVRTPDTTEAYVGAIELRLDPYNEGEQSPNSNLTGVKTATIKDGEVIGRLKFEAKPGEAGQYRTVTIDLFKTVKGEHDLVFVFYSSLGAKPITADTMLESQHKNGFEFDQWQFF